jgi:RNA polymerase sigma-70 factor (ECF subfamily)
MFPRVSAGGDPSTNDAAFQTTHWTVVMAARDRTSGAAEEALASLCQSYWYPLYAFVRRQGTSPEDAQDLTQEFFRSFLERDSLVNVSRAAGRFRSFLLACLKHFLSHERQRARAERRGGGRTAVSLEATTAEARYRMEPPDHSTPEVLFDRRWAWAVLDRTLEDLRLEYTRREQGDLFEDLTGFLPGGKGRASRAELAGRRGVSANAVDVAIHRLRNRFGALLRQRVSQTVAGETEVDEEIRYLMSVLGG